MQHNSTNKNYQKGDFDAMMLYNYLHGICDCKLILKPIQELSKSDSEDLAKIHGYDIPDDEGVRQELISIYTFDGEGLLLDAYLPTMKFIEGLFFLLNAGYDLFNLIPRNLAVSSQLTQPA